MAIKPPTPLSLAEHTELLSKLAQDFESYSTGKLSQIPNQLIYKIASSPDLSSEQSLRRSTLSQLRHNQTSGFRKNAFDTRHIDQETERNPRENMQYWNRSQQFIDGELQGKIDVFARLLPFTEDLKQSFGAQPEWHASYARTLHETLQRILRIKEADLDVFRPQISYLEQMLQARYQLSLENLSKIGGEDFKQAILKKDEALLKRGAYLTLTADKNAQESKPQMIKGTDDGMNQNIVNAIFGNNNFRRDGEKTVERTITITIRDSVVD